MKSAPRVALAAAVLALASPASATPSSTFWTVATTHTQPAGVPHLTYDTYFAEAGALQIDTGVTIGVLGLRRLQIEVGLDVYYPTTGSQGQMGTLDFLQLNGRITVPLGRSRSSALSFGICNLGFRKDVSNLDMLYGLFGWKTRMGEFTLGGYYGAGSKYLWLPISERLNNFGLMASWVSPDVRIGAPGLDKIAFLLDLAGPRNWVSGIGAAVAVYFTPSIAVRTGPVLFADSELYSSVGIPAWLWSVQLDVDLDLVRRKEEPGGGDASPEKTSAPPNSETPPSGV